MRNPYPLNFFDAIESFVCRQYKLKKKQGNIKLLKKNKQTNTAFFHKCLLLFIANVAEIVRKHQYYVGS